MAQELVRVASGPTVATRTRLTEPASRLDDALGFAFRVHAGQLRKGTTLPYISHPLAVAAIALEHGASEDETVAALLHDAIEDSREPLRTKAEIRRRFGAAVAEIVEGCTDSETQPKLPWRERKDRALAHLRTASPSVLLVAAADKTHNARAILADYQEVGDALWDRFNEKKTETLWYYRALADTFKRTGPHRLARELDSVVSEIEALAKRQA